MIVFEVSMEADLGQIAEWQALDDSKQEGLAPEYWLTGSPGSVLACRVDDAEGAVLYLRAEQENRMVRFHALFAPSDVVSQKRVALALLEGFPKFAAKMYGDGMVMQTRSESLARFMVNKFGFTRVEGTDDYKFTGAEVVAGTE